MTTAELTASNFLSLIERSTRDNDLKKKIRRSNTTIELITNLIHEYMYERLNESNNSNDGRKHNTYKNDNANEDGLKNPVTKDLEKHRTVKNQNTKTTGADNAVHQIGQERTTAQQNPRSVVTAKEEETTKECADH